MRENNARAFKRGQIIGVVVKSLQEHEEYICTSSFCATHLQSIAETAADVIMEIFKGENKMTAQSEFVDQYYEMNPETENLLDNGRLVVDGMKVLIEAPFMRANINDYMTPADTAQARLRNRWATVEKSKIIGVSTLSFIAVYDDGVKRQITESVDRAWLVKKDSIPWIDVIRSVSDETVFYVGRTDKVLEKLKAMHQEDLPHYRVWVGKTGELVDSEEYLVSEGMVAEAGEFTVWDEKGTSIKTGTAIEVLQWANSLPEGSDKYDGYEVGREGMTGGSSLKDFVRENC